MRPSVRPPLAPRLVVGIGEFAVTDSGGTIVTHALGSCVAVCIWDPGTRIGGLLHFLLPDSRINPERAERQPAAFADTGIPLLFQAAYARGLLKSRALVWIAGGADVTIDGQQRVLHVGRRNIAAARTLLSRNGVPIRGQDVGGRLPRTVTLSLGDGRVLVGSAGEPRRELQGTR